MRSNDKFGVSNNNKSNEKRNTMNYVLANYENLEKKKQNKSENHSKPNSSFE